MRIRVSYNENMHIWQADVPQVLIGRSRQNKPVDVDLSPDPTVSHQHARIWLEESQYWIEDLESKLGTHVSGKDIRGLGRWPLKLSEEIRIGRTNLVVEQVLASPAHTLTNEDFGEVGKTLDASQVIRIPLDSRADMESRLKLLY